MMPGSVTSQLLGGAASICAMAIQSTSEVAQPGLWGWDGERRRQREIGTLSYNMASEWLPRGTYQSASQCLLAWRVIREATGVAL